MPVEKLSTIEVCVYSCFVFLSFFLYSHCSWLPIYFLYTVCFMRSEVVAAAVTQDGWALQFAAPELRESFDIALPAVLSAGETALDFASETLQ